MVVLFVLVVELELVAVAAAAAVSGTDCIFRKKNGTDITGVAVVFVGGDFVVVIATAVVVM